MSGFYIHSWNYTTLLQQSDPISGIALYPSDPSIQLASGINLGLLRTPFLDPKLARSYLGFDVGTIETGITVAMVDSAGNLQKYNPTLNTWSVSTAYNTPEEIRLGLPVWTGKIQFQIKLERSPTGISPTIQLIKVGYFAPGSPIAYILEFGLPKLFSQPVTLTRWLDTADGVISDLNPARVSNRSPRLTGGKYHVAFDYLPKVTTFSGFAQIEETPCILLQLLDTRHHRAVESTESVRISGNRAELLKVSQIYDQIVEISVVAQSLGDIRQIAESIVAIVSQGVLNVEAYGIQVSLITVSHMKSDALDLDIVEGQLPSLTFEIKLADLPNAQTRSTSTLITGLEKPVMRAIAPS